jgi:hypothetical protein
METKLERLSAEQIVFNLSFMFVKQNLHPMTVYRCATECGHQIIEAFHRQGLEVPQEYLDATAMLFIRLEETIAKYKDELFEDELY